MGTDRALIQNPNRVVQNCLKKNILSYGSKHFSTPIQTQKTPFEIPIYPFGFPKNVSELAIYDIQYDILY